MRILITSTTDPKTDPRPVKLKLALQELGHSIGTYWIRSPKNPKILRHVIGLIKTLKLALNLHSYDIIHLIDGWDIGLLPIMFASRPVVFDIRSLWPLVARRRRNDTKTRLESFFRGLVTRFIVRASSHVTTVDPILAQEIMTMKPKGLTYLRNLPLTQMFDGVPFNSNDESIDFGWFGSIDPNRRVGELLRAWCRLIDEREEKCDLWVYGWVSANHEYYERSIEPYFEKDTIHHVGRVAFEDVPYHYRRMDVIVAPNAGDHWQLKLGEAIAAGVPLLARYGPLHHQLIGDEAVVYFHSQMRENDEDEILAALHEIVENIDRLKSEARKKKPLYWERDVNSLVGVYKRIRLESQ